MPVTVVDHPLAQHYLSQLRDQETQPERFRRVANHLTTLLVIEATKGLAQTCATVTTPLTQCETKVLGEGIAAVPILRAGLSMLEPVLQLFPDVKVGYVGLERHEDTAIARSYYMKLPSLEGRFTLCLDPMLATGGSAAQAIGQLKVAGAKEVVMVSVISAPEGIEFLQSQHPEVPIFTASVDERLNDKKYIVPGLGDFGDRLYGTM
ncbi:MAG: uracil phosphoribosyltransferase [Armatimonadetes bacterium]|nr:uracil phosphoribosyltransferase [Armatimonadota bacterium]MBS1702630.1 uracil phosphoribosyltransferase [Armatimonadota bacterium]MBS1726060.1 uracil phosphoribosyltransferase [Armatimonadota bacterium]